MAKKKTAYLISCSDHYGHRLHVTDACLKQMGYETVYITSDFDHNTKTKYNCEVSGCVQLHAKEYKKNLSISRILSHRGFAKTVFGYIESQETQPDLIICLLPPNFLAYFGAKYKKRHKNVKLVFDIFDLWPETFPSNSLKKLLAPVFKVWSNIRDKNLYAADFIFTECEMFRQMLDLDDKKSKTAYLCADPLENQSIARLSNEQIDLCYLGAINNIISIPDICALIKDLAKEKKTVLHIIGAGERQEEFVESAKEAGAEVIFYGAVYDEAKKEEIISKCHFGLNIMKSSVCVGLTMKSVDYFRHSLPIINNIPADTKNLVEEKGVGVPLDNSCAEILLSLSVDDCLKMRENVKEMFETTFEKNVVLSEIKSVFEQDFQSNQFIERYRGE